MNMENPIPQPQSAGQVGDMFRSSAITEHGARQMVKEGESRPEKLQTLVEETKAARVALQESFAGLSDAWEEFGPLSTKYIRDLRAAKMTMVAELGGVLKSFQDVRKFFICDEHEKEVKALREFVALWKSYIRKGMGDQEAANHVWLDLVRYDENSGAMKFWKNIPLNFFVPWRTGTYVTLYKQFTEHPIRTALFVGAVDYLREERYRQTGRWTHLPTDYIEGPIANAIQKPASVPSIAATTLLFGPGGTQAPQTIKDLMDGLTGRNPQDRARLLNVFWGISQLYNLPRDWQAFTKDKDPQHLVNLLTDAAIAEHSALKYEPSRLMKALPEWMPGMEKAELVKYAEQLQQHIQKRQDKSEATYEKHHNAIQNFGKSPEQQQLDELRRAAHPHHH